jgi:hypothetical protein
MHDRFMEAPCLSMSPRKPHRTAMLFNVASAVLMVQILQHGE